MAGPEELSNAQCLRVIGQLLAARPPNSFRLNSFGFSYTVSSSDSRKRAQTGFLGRALRKVFSSRRPEPADYVIFTRDEIYRLDVEQRRERKPHATSTLDRADVAFALRVIGDYMDRRNTPMFAVDWTPTTIVVHYGARRETFTHVNLFDLGKSMYLKRADRSR